MANSAPVRRAFPRSSLGAPRPFEFLGIVSGGSRPARARTSLCLPLRRKVAGYPKGAHFIRERGAAPAAAPPSAAIHGSSSSLPARRRLFEITRLSGGSRPMSLRPAMASADGAGLGADALPCVALFLPIRSAPLARSPPPASTKQAQQKERADHLVQGIGPGLSLLGGGGGSRTPVRRFFTPGYYVRFRSFGSRRRGPRPAGFPSDHPGLIFALRPPGRELGAIP